MALAGKAGLADLEVIFAHNVKGAVDVAGGHGEIIIGHHNIIIFVQQAGHLLEDIIDAVKFSVLIDDMDNIITLPFFGLAAKAGDNDVPIALAVEPAFMQRIIACARDDKVFFIRHVYFASKSWKLNGDFLG